MRLRNSTPSPTSASTTRPLPPPPSPPPSPRLRLLPHRRRPRHLRLRQRRRPRLRPRHRPRPRPRHRPRRHRRPHPPPTVATAIATTVHATFHAATVAPAALATAGATVRRLRNLYARMRRRSAQGRHAGWRQALSTRTKMTKLALRSSRRSLPGSGHLGRDWRRAGRRGAAGRLGQPRRTMASSVHLLLGLWSTSLMATRGCGRS